MQLPHSVASLLAKLRGGAGDDDPVFRSRKRRGALEAPAVFRMVRRAGIELAVSPHWLRHAHALDRGAPLSHASLSTTGRYLHAKPRDISSRFLAL